MGVGQDAILPRQVGILTRKATFIALPGLTSEPIPGTADFGGFAPERRAIRPQ
jgi:hypothetical protein